MVLAVLCLFPSARRIKKLIIERMNVSESFFISPIPAEREKMASLQGLLAQEEAFSNKSKQEKNLKHKKVSIRICHDQKSHDFSTQKTKLSSKESSCRRNSSSQTIDSNGEPPIDEVAIRAVISILSGYIGRYLKDENFRNTVKEKFNQFLVRKREENGDDEHEVVASLELGMGGIDRLVVDESTTSMESLRNSLIHVINDGCNIHVSAFAQLFLSVLYKLEKSDRISAIHLLQVFSNSPFLARAHLLSDLWDHLFLPHLLHLKVWYHKELEFLSSFDHDQVKKKRNKALKKLYNEKLDEGTIQFALYYKQWLKVGAKAPAVPTLSIPSSSTHKLARRRSLDSYTPKNNL